MSHRQHGTHVKYVIEKCRCDLCREANRAYERQRCRENAERRWGARPPIFVDARDAREHLWCLSEAGIGQDQVEVLSGISHTAQWKIRTGRVKRIRPETEKAILGVALTDHVADRSYIDAQEAREIVDSLLSIGFTKTSIARALGYKSHALQIPSRTGRCTLRNLRRLRLLKAITLRQAVTS